MKKTALILTATSLLLLGLPPAMAEAGKILFEQCFTARGDMADGVKAALSNGGLFYTWGGYSVAGKVMEGKPCPPINLQAGPDLFRGENAHGTNSIDEKLKKNVALDGLMNFRSIRDNQPLDKDPSKTTFTLKGNDIATKTGAAAAKWKFADPVIDITNLGPSTMTLLSVTAQIFNSQDPLDPALTFDPDGTVIAVTPTVSSSLDLQQGETAEFAFPLNGSPNWAFTYSYLFEGDLFIEMIASSVVPEPDSLRLLVVGLAMLVASGACRLRRDR